MTRKEQILSMIGRLDDDVSYDRVLYHLGVMKRVEIGMEQAANGQVHDLEEVFDELLSEDAESQTHPNGPGKTGPPGRQAVHRPGLAKGGRKLPALAPGRAAKAPKLPGKRRDGGRNRQS